MLGERGGGVGVFNSVKMAFIKRSLIWWQTTLNNFKRLNVQSSKECDSAVI